MVVKQCQARSEMEIFEPVRTHNHAHRWEGKLFVSLCRFADDIRESVFRKLKVEKWEKETQKKGRTKAGGRRRRRAGTGRY